MARRDEDTVGRRPPGPLRWAAAALMACVAVASVFPAYGALSNLWADYQDSPMWVYVVFGGFYAAVSVGSAAGVALILRRRS